MLSRLLRLLGGITVVLLIGVVDYASGREITLAILYLLPVAGATWLMGRGTGVFFAVISAVSSVAADLVAGHQYSHSAIPYWNMFVRFGFFLTVVVILSRLQSSYEREKALSTQDALTGVLNGRAFQERAAAEIERARRYGHPLTVAYIDLDDFKAVNDRFGHSTGNTVLCTVAEAALRNVRATDIVARLGGDEFALLLPETGEGSAEATLEKILSLICTSLEKDGWTVGLSIGAVTFRTPPDSIDEMLRRADVLLYEAKRAGKHRMRHEIQGS